MFFAKINEMMNQSVDITLVIRKKEGQLLVSVMPKANGLKDEAQNHIVPLSVSGTPEELDSGFLPAICQPIQKVAGLLTNMSQFEQQADKAAANSRAVKELKDKEAKEAKEKKEKFDKLIKNAEELETGQKLSEAMSCLKQARMLAAPQVLPSVDQKINAIRLKLSQGSLFEMKPSPEIPQAVPANHSWQEVQPQVNNHPVQISQSVMNFAPEPEPETAMSTSYPTYREGEYDQYPDFPYPNNPMFHQQNR